MTPAAPLPEHVLADLLGSGDFPGEVSDTEAAAQVILGRLSEAGFAVLPLGPWRCPRCAALLR